MLLAPTAQFFQNESSPCLSNVWGQRRGNSEPSAAQENGARLEETKIKNTRDKGTD